MQDGPDRWRRIDALFDAALELEGRERERFVDRETVGDAELRDEVVRLLAAAESGDGSWLPDLSGILGALADELSGGAVAGRRIGADRVLGLLGRGERGEALLVRTIELSQCYESVAHAEALHSWASLIINFPSPSIEEGSGEV